MDPISAAIAGAGAIANGIASYKSAKSNEDIAKLNMALKNASIEEQRAIADRMRKDAMLGITDEYGNRLRFVEGKGWVTELSPESQALSDAQRREQYMSVTRDRAQARRAEDANEKARLGERAQADALMDEFRNTRRGDPEAMRTLLLDRARIGIDEGHRDVENTALRGALRTGNSNTNAIVAALGKSRGDAMRKASLDAAIAAEDRVDDKYNSARNNIGQLYAVFGDRASRLPGHSYQPADVTAGTTGKLSTFTGQMSGGNDALLKAFGNVAEQPYTSPNTAIGDTLSSLGSIYGGYKNSQNADAKYAALLDAFKKKNSGAY